jgi:outer membrane protein X
MKRILVSFALCLAGLTSFAQHKGDVGLGINFGVAPCVESGVSLTNVGLGAKFRYNVSNPVRLEADFDYWFKSKSIDFLDLSANVHYVFNAGNKFHIYPLLGIGYARVNSSCGITDYDIDYNGNLNVETGSVGVNRFLVNVGAGVDYDVTDKIALGFELKYQYIQDFSRLPITFSLTFNL